MGNDSSGQGRAAAAQQRTIGVVSNRQLYVGSTISRYEQTLLRGVRAAAHAHGVNLLLACGVGPDATPFEELRESYRALRQMLAAGADFTAVLASNDESAIGVLQALAEAGRRVPQDVAVIGFDDVLYAKAQEPPLTTVRHPTFELGYRALELLLAAIEGEPVEPPPCAFPPA